MHDALPQYPKAGARFQATGSESVTPVSLLGSGFLLRGPPVAGWGPDMTKPSQQGNDALSPCDALPMGTAP